MRDTESIETCPVCLESLSSPIQRSSSERQRVNCRNCGEHVFEQITLDALSEWTGSSEQRNKVAFRIRRTPVWRVVSLDVLDQLRLSDSELPSATERIDNLVVHLAREYAPGQSVTIDPAFLRAITGAATEEQAEWIVKQAMNMNLIDGDVIEALGRTVRKVKRATLSIAGWGRFDELMRQGVGSRHAFMAMQYRDRQLEIAYKYHMKPAVAETGFQLRAMADEHQTAGLIDDRMRVEIRTSRFVVCDLTHGNRGVYWEAGFAEGVGRKVFFTCRQDVLEDKSAEENPHFDTSHQLIIPWDPSDMPTFKNRLKSAIRATLPDEAKMS